jgi:hypothetical protein
MELAGDEGHVWSLAQEKMGTTKTRIQSRFHVSNVFWGADVGKSCSKPFFFGNFADILVF